jgi:hypothetical protein
VSDRCPCNQQRCYYHGCLQTEKEINFLEGI